MAGLFLVGLLGGCAGGQRSLSKPELMNLAVERVEERYGVSCTATTALEEGSGPFGPVTMVVTLESGGETFQASMDTDGGNIRDNYPLVWMRPRAEEAAQSLAETVWPDAVGTAELTAAPFSEQMEEEDSLADFFACASPLAEWDIQIPEGRAGGEGGRLCRGPVRRGAMGADYPAVHRRGGFSPRDRQLSAGCGGNRPGV